MKRARSLVLAALVSATLLLPLLAREARAGPDAAFAPPHADLGVDLDADTLFDILAVGVAVNVTTPGTYNVTGTLWDSANTTQITAAWNAGTLPGGPNTVPLYFAGPLVYRSLLDGPYWVALVLENSTGVTDSGGHLTAAYLHTDFDPPQAFLKAPFTDAGLDTNGDLLYNNLLVNGTVAVGTPGLYLVGGALLDSPPTRVIATVLTFVLGFTAADYPFTLNFTGVPIRQSGYNGSFQVNMTLVNATFTPLDYVEDLTGPYTWDQFELPPAYFTPPHADYGYDRDVPPDGDYNVIAVNLSLHVDGPGTYIVQATWYNSTHTLPLDLRLNITTLPPGDHHLELWFSAMSATLFFQSGPFVVDFGLYGLVGGVPMALDSGTYTTQPYAFAQLQSTLFPRLVSGHVENALNATPIQGLTPFFYNWTNDWSSLGTGQTNANGDYTLFPIFPGDFVAVFDDAAHNADLSVRNLQGFVFTEDAQLYPTAPNRAYVNFSWTDWDTMALAEDVHAETDNETSRWTFDYGVSFLGVAQLAIGDRNLYLNKWEMDKLVQLFGLPSFDLPAPVSTIGLLSTDQRPYLLQGGSAVNSEDVEGPVTLDRPMRLSVTADYTPIPPVPAADLHYLNLTVAYDTNATRNAYRLDFAPGYRLLWHTPTANVSIQGLAQPWATVDPGPDPDPNDGLPGEIVTLIVGNANADTSPPSITATATPPTQTYGGYVNASAVVTDTWGVASVAVNITGPAGSLGNFTLIEAGGSYSYNTTYPVVGSYTATFWASDLWGNWGTAAANFGIVDTTAPTITNVTVTPSPAEVLGAVTLSGDFVDDYGFSIFQPVSDFSVLITPPTMPSFGPLMVLTWLPPRVVHFDAYFPVDETGTWTWFASATDPSGNTGTATGTFEVIDTTPPVVTAAATPAIQEAGLPTNITASATDYAVATANVTIAGVGTFPMAFDGGSWYYEAAFPLGTQAFAVAATDASGNMGSDAGTFDVVDTTSPVVTAAATPSTQSFGLAVNITADVTDYAVASVEVTITGVVGTFPMALTAGTWHYAAVFPAGAHAFNVTATDTSGNSGSATGSFTIVDTVAPTAEAGADLAVKTDELFVFNGSGSTDDAGISSYSWAMDVNGTLVTLGGVGPSYAFDEPGTYTATLTVTDIGGNTGTDAVTVTVLARTPRAPANLQAAVTGPTTVSLTWGAVTENDDGSVIDDLAGYEVYRSPPGAGTYTKLTATPIAATAFADPTATGDAYDYRVRAVNAYGVPSSGADVTATILGGLRGTVVDTNGAPLAGVGVAAVDAAGNVVAQAVTDASGQFALSGLRWNVTLRVARGGYDTREVLRDVPPGGVGDIGTIELSASPAAPPGGVPLWVLLALALIVLAAMVLLLLMRRRKQEEPAPTEQPPEPEPLAKREAAAEEASSPDERGGKFE